MSQYFSRLAERSGVTPAVSSANSRASNANASAAWSEQTAETIAVRGANFPVIEKMANYTDSTIFKPTSEDANSSVDAGKYLLTENFETQEDQTFSAPQKNSAVLTKEKDSRFAEKSSAPWAEKNLAAAPLYLESDNTALRSTVSNDEIIAGSEKNIAVSPQNNSSLANSLSKKISVNNLQAKSNKSFHDDSAADATEQSMSSKNETALEYQQPYQASVRPTQRAQAPDRIESSPAHSAATTPPEKSMSSRISSSSIEVHIGKIELEIHASATKPASAPAPPQVTAPAISPRAKSASFNPHRHYLRSH
jgi:hypothetical protein